MGRAGERGTSSGGGGGRRSEGRCGLAQLHDRAPEERRPPQHRPLCARSALPAQPLAEEPDGCVCLGPPLPHLHQDWAHPCPICNGTGGGVLFCAHRISCAVDRLRRWAWRASSADARPRPSESTMYSDSDTTVKRRGRKCCLVGDRQLYSCWNGMAWRTGSYAMNMPRARTSLASHSIRHIKPQVLVRIAHRSAYAARLHWIQARLSQHRRARLDSALRNCVLVSAAGCYDSRGGEIVHSELA